MLLRHALLSDGSRVDVRVVDGRVAEVGPDLARIGADDALVDLDGRLLVPAFAEPHAHLDKAYLAERVPNPSGDLMGAIVAMQSARHLLTVSETVDRAERAARAYAAHGTVRIRSHADATPGYGLVSVEALAEVRRRVADLVDIEIVALAGWPITGREGAEARSILRDSLDAGADLVGGCPHLEGDPAAATDVFLTIAADADRGVDLHTDETLDPTALSLLDLARKVMDTGFPNPVTASHCVSLSMLPADQRARVADAVAEAGIGVVALPQTNLFLQGRDALSATPRGITAVHDLRRAGVVVAAGGDNLQDPFNPLGRADPLEAAGLMVAAAHDLPDDALRAVSTDAHRLLGADAPAVAVGAPADLVAVPTTSVRALLAEAPSGRVVIRRGRLLSAHDGNKIATHG